MLLKIIYVLVRRLFGLAVLMFRCDSAKDAELLVLRHENAVLRRHAGRVRYDPADRVWFAALARLIPRNCWPGIIPVTPATLLTWHRKRASWPLRPNGVTLNRLLTGTRTAPRTSYVTSSPVSPWQMRSGFVTGQAPQADVAEPTEAPV